MRTELREGEKVILVTSKHWFTLVPNVFFVALSILVYFAIPVSFPFGGFLRDITKLAIPVLFIYLVYSYFERKFNIWAVTTKRVIDEWGVFSRNAKESPLDKINNVSHSQTIIGRMFGFGDVIIQTAATAGATIFSLVESPGELHEAIVKAQSQCASQQGIEVKEVVKSEADTRECPFCAETIKAKAVVCRYCGRDSAPSPSEEVEVIVSEERSTLTEPDFFKSPRIKDNAKTI